MKILNGHCQRIVWNFFFFVNLVVFFPLVGQEIDPPLATVRLEKTEVIGTRSFEEQIAMLEAQTGKTVDSETKKKLLENLINEKIVLQVAEKEGVIVSRDEVIDFALLQMEKQVGKAFSEEELFDYISTNMGIGSDEFIKKMQGQLTVQKYMQSKTQAEGMSDISISDGQVEQFYNENSTNFVNPDLVRFKHVFYNTQGKTASAKKTILAKAEASLKEILTDNSLFSDKVASESEDSNSKLNGGDVGYIARTEKTLVDAFGSSFIKTLFNLPVNEYSQKVIESNVGYHIIYVEEFLPKHFLSLEDPIRPDAEMTVRQYVRNGLLSQEQQKKTQETVQTVINNLRSKADIKILNDSYKS